jgi:predicted transcriptional regulator
MAAPKRTPAQRERDREHVATLYLKGWSQSEIANYLEVSQPLISKELKAIKAKWHSEQLEQYEFYIAQELDRLRLIEKEAWEAWERSKQTKEQTLSEKLRSASPDDLDLETGAAKLKIQRRTIDQVGDPKFLEQLLKVHQARAKLLNLGDTSTAKPQGDTLAVSSTQLAVLAEYLSSNP